MTINRLLAMNPENTYKKKDKKYKLIFVIFRPNLTPFQHLFSHLLSPFQIYQLIIYLLFLGMSHPETRLEAKSAHSQIQKLRELEGQCKIQEFQLLRINYPKAIFFSLLMAISIIGLLLLKYYKKLRVCLLYSSIDGVDADLITHIFVKGSDQNDSICDVADLQYEGMTRKVFMFKHLRYEYRNQECFPLGLRYDEAVRNCDKRFLSSGLEEIEADRREHFFGRNEHLVQVPHYFEYLFDTMTQPFFIFQYLVSIVYILENVGFFGALMIVFSFITTSINYILLYRSYQQIKETAEKQFEVTVLRGGKMETIQNVELACGDLYIPNGEIPCDSILLAGELFLDQSSLTGQSVPIPKFKLSNIAELEEKNHWIFQGSMVKTQKQGTLALAVHVGFGSRRGRIIRKILTKKPKQPEFFKKMIYFQLEILLIGLILYGATVKLMLSLNIEKILIVFRFLDFITYSFPAQLPIFFNLAYSFCLVRLRRDEIYGTQCQKTIESSRLRTLCFDKTGTLTHTGMKVANIFTVHNNISDITSNLAAHPLISDLFGCCNSVETINGKYEGDEIDLKMFHYVKAQITGQKSSNFIRCIKVQDRVHEVLRINEYESRFQSMSVLYRHRQTNRFFIIAKGSPQMIHAYSQSKVKDYEAFIKKLSLQGFRSIAFGWKDISERQVGNFIKADRQYFLKNINITGVVTFINFLKEDAQRTIRALTESDINTKIITGDNIFLGVQTAILTGMVPHRTKVIILEGKKFSGNGVDATQIQRLENGQITQNPRFIERFRFEESPVIVYAIDNDFIKSHPETFLHNQVKVFARITPQNKALIIRKHKEIISDDINSRSFWQGIVGESSTKVGMVGDGANDLIAIKDADLGIGISSSDAVYSASFAVKDLQQIIEIICEGKNTQQQIIELTQYFLIGSFVSIPSIIILTTDVTFPTSMQSIYKNFITTLLMTLFFALSRPAKELSKFLPNSNFMGMQNHLVFWISSIIFSAGQAGAYYYYYYTDDFVPNPQPYATFQTGWNGNCKTSTVNFLILVLQFTLLPIFIYRSAPWKEELYKNIPLAILIIINFGLIIPIYFETANLSFLELQPIGQGQAGIILIITAASCLICWIANLVIQRLRFHERRNQETSNKLDITEETNVWT